MPFCALPQRPFKVREADFDGTVRSGVTPDPLLPPMSPPFRTDFRTLTPERCDRQGAAAFLNE